MMHNVTVHFLNDSPGASTEYRARQVKVVDHCLWFDYVDSIDGHVLDTWIPLTAICWWTVEDTYR